MANWKYVKIGDVCTVERGGSPRPIDKFITDDPNGINWIKIGDTDDSMYITKTAQKIIPEGMKKSRYVQPGDFLLSNSMSFGRPYILKIDGCIHDGWLVLRDNNGIFDKRFLYYYLSAPSTYQKFKNMAVGGVVNNLNSDMVRGVTVPVPTMEEQLNIVSALDKVTELITLRKEQLAKLDQLVKSRFIELFGDVKTNKLGWEKCKFGDVSIKITDGEHGTAPRVNKGEGYLYLMARNITKDGTVDLSETSYVPEDVHRKIYKRCNPEKGDILLVCVGATIGKCTIVPADLGEFSMARSVALIKPDKQKVDNAFLISLLKSDAIQSDISECAHAAAQAGLYTNMIVNLDAFLPPLELQKQFAAFVEQTDKSKLAIQQSLDKLELLKKSLMQEYFG